MVPTMTARVRANDIDIAYTVDGTGEPLLLIMGLGGQLTDWHPAFVNRLAEHFTVIRFDNRDAGLTTYCDTPVPTRWDLIKAQVRPSAIDTTYRLPDMASDAAGLLQALDVPRAHVVGMSMGGMIAQQLALDHPRLVTSLCSVMSNTGDRRNGRPTARVVRSMVRRGEPDRRDAIDVTIGFFRLVGGPDWDETEQRRRSSASIDRAYNPAGILRQSLAIAASPDRTARLSSVAQPTLVMHGLADTLVRPSGGIATARAIPSSRLLMFPRMGHDLPATRHAEMVAAICNNASRGAM